MPKGYASRRSDGLKPVAGTGSAREMHVDSLGHPGNWKPIAKVFSYIRRCGILTNASEWHVNPLRGEPPTGEPDAGDPHVRFGGRGDRTQSILPTPIRVLGKCLSQSAGSRLSFPTASIRLRLVGGDAIDSR